MSNIKEIAEPHKRRELLIFPKIPLVEHMHLIVSSNKMIDKLMEGVFE